MTVRQGEGQHTSYDEFFARTKGFVYEVKNGAPDYGAVETGGRSHLVTDVEVHQIGDELVELVIIYPMGREPVYLPGRRRRV